MAEHRIGLQAARTELPVASTQADRACLVGSRVCLLGGPYVVQQGRRIGVPDGSKRLLAFIALHEGRVDRHHAAGTLWPFGDDDRACGNLRSSLWRLKGAGIDVVRADKCALWLDPQTDLDVNTMESWAERIIDGKATGEDLRLPTWGASAMDLLAGWYDDWIIFERERLRQRLLHALEALSRLLVQARRYADAIDAALEAVRAEPLRESAHRTLLEAHLAEGNLIEARRIHLEYARLLMRELGADPDPALAALVRPRVMHMRARL
jgi:DNA-binding SARP family transcriptional activator